VSVSGLAHKFVVGGDKKSKELFAVKRPINLIIVTSMNRMMLKSTVAGPRRFEGSYFYELHGAMLDDDDSVQA
jgi:hypothetical protein